MNNNKLLILGVAIGSLVTSEVMSRLNKKSNMRYYTLGKLIGMIQGATCTEEELKDALEQIGKTK